MKIKAKGPDFAELDYTPMIDMTFQLIAFFMILINFADGEQDQRVKLPSSVLAKPPQAALEVPITIQLLSDGMISMNLGKPFLSPEAIKPILGNERYILESQRHKVEDATIIIRADRNVKTGRVQNVIKVCQEMGFQKFSLRARSETGY